MSEGNSAVEEIVEKVGSLSTENEPVNDVIDANDANASSSSDKKKKKKKKNKNKKPAQVFENSIGNIYRGVYPEGEFQDYNLKRTTDEEIRADFNLEEAEKTWNKFRKGAEIHRRARKYARENMKPGMTMIEIVEMIENQVREMSGTNDSLKGEQ